MGRGTHLGGVAPGGRDRRRGDGGRRSSDADDAPAAVETREADGDESRGDDALVGPDSPLPGALSGRLVVTTADGCRLRVVDLASVELGELGPTTTCAIWASPAGQRAAVVTAHSLADPGAGRFSLVRLGDPPRAGASARRDRG